MKRRSGSSFQVTIRQMVKTCPFEAGQKKLQVPDGAKILWIGMPLYNSHDRKLQTAIDKILIGYKPNLTIILGPVIHEEALKALVDEQDEVSKFLPSKVLPEIAEIKAAYTSKEDRWLAFGAKAGQYLQRYADLSGGDVIIIPAVKAPSEIDAMRWMHQIKDGLDRFADNHPDEALKGPEIPRGLAEFLALDQSENVHVMDYSSAVIINGELKVHCGNFKRRQPGEAARVDVEQDHMSTVRGFDGKLASWWFTTPLHSLPEPLRKYWQGHEVGNIFDLSAGLGYMTDYDRRCHGVLAGVIIGGIFHGCTHPFIRGKDGRRCVVIDGQPYCEDEAGGYGNVSELTLNKMDQAPVKSAKPAPSVKPNPIQTMLPAAALERESPKPDAAAQPEIEVTVAKPKSKAKSKPKPSAKAKPEAKPKAKPSTKSKPEAKPKAKPSPKSKPEAKPKAKPSTKSKPEAKPKAKPSTKSKPEAKPKVKPTRKPRGKQ